MMRGRAFEQAAGSPKHGRAGVGWTTIYPSYSATKRKHESEPLHAEHDG